MNNHREIVHSMFLCIGLDKDRPYFYCQTGLTVKQYHTRLRVERAKFLLAHSDMQIQEISARLGFLNRRYFTATFKSAVGVTPQEYRALRSN